MFKRLSGLIFLFIFITTCICDPSAATAGLRVLETFLDERSIYTSSSHVFKESMPSVSTRDDLQRLNRVQADIVHEIIVVVKQRNMDLVETMLHDISNPESPNYGQHLTREQVTDMTINIEACDAVKLYLALSGLVVKDVSPGGEFVTAEAPIPILEKFFKTEFYHFEISSTKGQNRRYVRADKYSIPSELDLHVESVLNIVEVPNETYIKPILRPKTRHSSNSGSGSNSFETSGVFDRIGPGQLRAFYNVSDKVKGSDKSTQMVVAILGEYYSPSDLKKFQITANLPNSLPKSIGNHESDTVCRTSPDNCLEANLDVQYVMGMSPGSETTFWYSDDNTFAAWMVSVAAYTPLPLVITISYGSEESHVTKAESDAFNIVALKLNIMGTTILAASGDDGAHSRKVRNKMTSNCRYMPVFPASSPYVTAVGATSVCFLSLTPLIISLPLLFHLLFHLDLLLFLVLVLFILLLLDPFLTLREIISCFTTDL
jgi:tripeptidyl-peptidase I